MENINKETILIAIRESEYALISTHQKLCLPIIKRIYKKMINEIKFDDIKVCDLLIIDGHNRYVSSLLANELDAKFNNLPIEKIIEMAK